MSRRHYRRNPVTPNQKLAMVGVAGLGALAIALLAFGGTASAATGGGSSTPTLDPNSARGLAAASLASAIQSAGGYQGTQKSLITAYQSAAGLTADGFPGSNTMTSLKADLNAMGVAATYPTVMSLATYAWTAAGGWSSGNVPAAFADGSGAAWNAGTAVGT